MRVRSGFTLIGVVITMVVLCLVAIAMVPQFSSAASDGRIAALCNKLQDVRRHIEVYRRQHEGQMPASPAETGDDFARRITEAAGDGDSTPASADLHLQRMPVNPFNDLATVRVGGVPAGAGTHGWRFDPVTGDFQADDRCDADGDGRPEHVHL